MTKKKKLKIYLGLYLTKDQNVDTIIITAPDKGVAFRTLKEALNDCGLSQENLLTSIEDVFKIDKKFEYFQFVTHLKDHFLLSLEERLLKSKREDDSIVEDQSEGTC